MSPFHTLLALLEAVGFAALMLLPLVVIVALELAVIGALRRGRDRPRFGPQHTPRTDDDPDNGEGFILSGGSASRMAQGIREKQRRHANGGTAGRA